MEVKNSEISSTEREERDPTKEIYAWTVKRNAREQKKKQITYENCIRVH